MPNTFTYTLSVTNLVVNAEYVDFLTGRLAASLRILYRPVTDINGGYSIPVGEITSSQLSAAACLASKATFPGSLVRRTCLFTPSAPAPAPTAVGASYSGGVIT